MGQMIFGRNLYLWILVESETPHYYYIKFCKCILLKIRTSWIKCPVQIIKLPLRIKWTETSFGPIDIF